MSQNMQLKIDEDIRRLMIPLTEEQYRELEQKILVDYSLNTVTCWQDIIVAGQEIYQICTEKNIPFNIRPVPCSTKEEAMCWLIKSQMEKWSGLPTEFKKYLIGKRAIVEYSAEKMARNEGGVTHATKRGEGQIREDIGNEYNISPSTVRKYLVYARMIDNLYTVDPAFGEAVRTGEIKITHQHLEHILSLPQVDQAFTIKRMMAAENISLSETRSILNTANVEPPTTTVISQPGTVKDMPRRDPDAEIKSLALTIPSWVSSIQRVNMATEFQLTSQVARDKLILSLTNLLGAANKIMTILEVYNGRYQ